MILSSLPGMPCFLALLCHFLCCLPYTANVPHHMSTCHCPASAVSLTPSICLQVALPGLLSQSFFPTPLSSHCPLSLILTQYSLYVSVVMLSDLNIPRRTNRYSLHPPLQQLIPMVLISPSFSSVTNTTSQFILPSKHSLFSSSSLALIFQIQLSFAPIGVVNLLPAPTFSLSS